MLAYFSTSFGAYHRCLDIPPFLWRCIPTVLEKHPLADNATRQIGAFCALFPKSRFLLAVFWAIIVS